jgi:MFS family permease
VPESASVRGAAVWLGLLLFVSHAYFMPAPASNELSRFALVRSIVERGHLDIDPYAETTADLARFGGHSYSDKAPGAALLAVPAYALYVRLLDLSGAPRPAFVRESAVRAVPGGQEDRLLHSPSFRRGVTLCNVFTNAWAGALLGALFFVLLCRWGTSPRRALLFTVALSGGSLIFAYSTVFFGHVLAAAALFAALLALDLRRPVLAGLGAGLAVLCELPAVLGAAVLLVALLASSPRGRWAAGLRFAAGAAGPVLVLLVYQTACFGRPWSAGYAHLADPTFAAGMSGGVLGVGLPRPTALATIFFGRSRGLFYLAPVLLLAAVGLGRGLLRPKTRPLALPATAIVAAFALLSAGYYMWWGGAALGPRHFIPALPFLCLGFTWMGGDRRLRALFFVLLVISVVNQLGATAVSPLAPPGVDLLVEYTYPRLARGELALYPGSTNLGLLLGLRGLASLVPLLALWALGAWTVLGALPPASPAGTPA